MRRFVLAASLLTLSLAVTATPATAQGFVGAGVTTPMGDFGDGAKMGWAVNAGFRPWQSADKRMSLWAEGLFGQNNFMVVDHVQRLPEKLPLLYAGLTR